MIIILTYIFSYDRFVGTLGMTLLTTFNILPYHYLIYNMDTVWSRFEIWRIFSGCLYAGGLGINFVMHLYMLYSISMAYETSPYNTGAGGSSADYLWMCLLGMFSICLIDPFIPLMPHSDAFLYFIMYVRARRSPEDMMNMWGFKFKALYMPWVYVMIRLVMGGSIKSCVAGVVIGHIFYFLVDALPVSNGVNIIKTPQLVVDMVSYASGRSQPPAVTVNTTRTADGARPPPVGGTNGYTWGRGNRLGSDN